MHDETPGFDFELQYAVQIGKEERVIRVTPNDAPIRTYRLSVQIAISEKHLLDAKKEEQPFSRLTDYHPSKIIASSSGPAQQMEEALIHSPLSSLISDIYDLSRRSPATANVGELERLKTSIRQHHQDPKFLFMGPQTAPFVLIALCAMLPQEQSEQGAYINKRHSLLQIVKDFQPVWFTLTVNEAILQQLEHGELKPTEEALRIFCQLIGCMTSEMDDSVGDLYDACQRTAAYKEEELFPAINRTFYYFLNLRTKPHAVPPS